MPVPTSRYSNAYSKPLKPKRRYRLVVLMCIAFLSLIFIHAAFQKKGEAQIKPAITAQQKSQALAVMDSKINRIISQNSRIDIAVAITDLQSAKTRNYGVQVPFEAASTSKLITALDFLHQTEAGSQTLGEPIGSSTAKAELKLMIVNSDNDAWQALNDQLGDDSLASYTANAGVADYNKGNNTLQASDIALLLQKLYTNKLLNETNTQLLLGYMRIANEADYIPAAVPNNIKVYHKAGLLEDRVHDAAIIDNGQNPYVLIVFTNGHGMYDMNDRADIIHSITAATLSAFKAN